MRYSLAAFPRMSLNPYAPPMAAVADIAPPEDVATEPPFFAVSLLKLAVMAVCTFSVYEVYWFYKHWQRISEREREPIFPFTRAFFAVFYCHACFSRIRDHGRASDLGSRLYALPLTIGFIVTTLTWRLPEPYDWISMAAFVFLLPVQHHANRLNAMESPSHNRNSRFTGWNWVAVVVGGGLMLLAIAGEFLVPPDA
jgi:hypothetical protein